MANLFICSCGDHYDGPHGGQKFDVFQDCTVTAPGGGYDGGRALTSSVPAYTRVRAGKRVGPSPGNEITWGFKYNAPTGTFPLGTEYVAYILGAIHGPASAFGDSTKQVSINVLNDGRLEARRGAWFDTVIGTTVAPVFDNSAEWINVGCSALIGSSGGLEIKRNGITVLTLTGVNTQGQATSGIGLVEWVPWTLDDLYVNDRSGSDARHTGFYPGGFHVKVGRPIADSAVQWVPLSGANYSQVADTDPDDAATTVRSQFAGDVDLYQLETIPTGNVLVVQGNLFCSRPGSGSPITVVFVVEIDGIRYESAAGTVTTSQLDLRAIWPVAPDDGLPWTATKMNAARWGFKRV